MTLRAIAIEDIPLLAASFERLSEESRYRRFHAFKDELSSSELAYFADVDHNDHEAIIAIDASSGEALGAARYVRSKDDVEVAEVAVTVVDDWQHRGLGRALLNRLTYHARRAGVRRFKALVQGDNPNALGLIAGAGGITHQSHAGVVDLIIELPPKRGIGAQLARVLRAAAAGDLVPAKTRAGVAVGEVEASPLPPPASRSPDPDDRSRHGRIGDG